MTPYKVLFICTGNSARSILAEGPLNHLGRGRFAAYSAGSHPKGPVHPLALAALREFGIPTDAMRSKSWDVFAGPDAPRMDFVITVCDQAAGELRPHWPGQPVTAHWGTPDPAAVEGSPEARTQAFRDAAVTARRRIQLLLDLPLTKLDALAIERRSRLIGEQ